MPMNAPDDNGIQNAHFPEQVGPATQEHTRPQSLAPETYKNIIQRLNPAAPVRAPRNIFVPPLLEDIAVKVQAAAALNGFTVKDIVDINYGKKIVLSKGFAWGEVNVYHGRHGFSIIQSPKRGSDANIARQTEELIRNILLQPCEVNYINPEM